MELQKEVLIYKRARESLQECERTEKIRDTIYEVAENERPIQHKHVKRFRGNEVDGLHILKIGDYRVVLGEIAHYLVVILVSRRKDAYKNISSIKETWNNAKAELS